MVVESAILLGVEHFEQGRRRIAAEVGRHLIDLIEQQHGIARTGLAHALDDLAGKGADVRAAMATNLGLVAHATDLPSEVLPTPGGPTRHRIGPFIWPTRVCTARYSRMRCLTLSSP